MTTSFSSAAAAALMTLGAATGAANAHQMHGCGGGMARPVISVTGEGEARIAPDMATISLGVTTQAKTAAEAMSQNSTRQQAVIDALKANKIEDKDIQTSGLMLTPLSDYAEGKAPTITGYQASNMVTVAVHDLTQLGIVLDGIVTAGANEMNGITFTRQDSSSAQDAARTDAVHDAQHRAEVMAKAAGLTLGPILSMGEPQVSTGPEPVMMRAAMDAKMGGSVPVESGQLSVLANVSVTYALDGGEMPGAACPMGGPMDHAMPGGPDLPAPAEAAPAAEATTDPAANGTAPASGN